MGSTAVAAPSAETAWVEARAGWVLPASVIALGLLLRLYHLGAWNLELDEATSVITAAQPLGAIWPYIIRTDPYHPPLFHFLLHLWGVLGDSDFMLRLLSVVFGTLSIGMVYRIGAYLVDRRVGLMAALISAVSPFQVWYAQEARMYAALLLLSLISLDALARLIREDRTSQWLVYVAATALSLYTDYGAFLVLAAHNAAVAALAALRQGPRLGKWVLAQGGIVAIYLPWAMEVLRTLCGIGAVPVGPYHESPAVAALPVPTFFKQAAWLMATFTSAFLPERHPLLKLTVILLYGTVAAAGLWMLWRQRISWVLLAAFTAVPIAVALMLSIKIQVVLPRTVIPASAGYYLLIAAGLLAIRRRPLRLLLGAGLLAANALSLALIYFHVEKSPPWSQIAAHLSSEIRPGEGVLFVDGRWRWVFGHYYHGPGQMDAEAFVDPGDLGRALGFAEGHRALFLVLKEDRQIDPTGQVLGYVRAHFARTERVEFPGGVAMERYHR